MEGQSENLKKPADNLLSTSSALENGMPAGKPDNFDNPNNPNNSFEALSRGESLKESEGNGELTKLDDQTQFLQSEQSALPKPQDLANRLSFPEPDPKTDFDYPKKNYKKGIIPMILGFLEFLLRIFGFKKDKFTRI